MSSFVLDTSVTMSWFFEDEATPPSIAILDVLRASQALVPSLWPLEVANVLLVAERRGRTKEARSSRFIALLNSLPIVVDPATADQALATTLHLGRQFGLSSYDASYLELAMREGCPLATLDEKLRIAAKKSGVPLMGQ
jgi:predicted nucleic acid-binding protein